MWNGKVEEVCMEREGQIGVKEGNEGKRREGESGVGGEWRTRYILLTGVSCHKHGSLFPLHTHQQLSVHLTYKF